MNYIIYVLYIKHFALTKDLHTLLHVFKFNFEFNQKHLCYNYYLTLFFQLIRIRPIIIINKHRFEERITKKTLYLLFVFF